MSLNVDLLAIEALTLGGLAVALHASSHRYGLRPPARVHHRASGRSARGLTCACARTPGATLSSTTTITGTMTRGAARFAAHFMPVVGRMIMPAIVGEAAQSGNGGRARLDPLLQDPENTPHG